MINSALVLGCGSIGLRHIRNLRFLGVDTVFAFDPVSDRLEAASRTGAIASQSMDDALARRPDAVLVCTPPHLHHDGISRAIEAGAHCFVEKPISHTLDGVTSTIEAAERAGIVLMIGYNLRFDVGLRKMKEMLDTGAIGRLLVAQAEFGQYLPDWRPQQDYRAGYNVRATMGGGIILDASHEIDYVQWLGGDVSRVYCVAGKLGDIEMNVEDTAAMILQCAGGVVAEVHLDSLQRVYSRRCKLIGTEGVLRWEPRAGVQWAAPGREWSVVSEAADPNDMYVDELRHFLSIIDDDDSLASNARNAARVLRIALAARTSAATGAAVDVQ